MISVTANNIATSCSGFLYCLTSARKQITVERLFVPNATQLPKPMALFVWLLYFPINKEGASKNKVTRPRGREIYRLRRAPYVKGRNNTTIFKLQNKKQSGFTLVEILVALVIMVFVSILAYQAFDGILAMEQRSKTEFLGQNRLHLAASVMLNDFIHLRQRPIRDELGGQKPAYLAPSGDYAVEFTRGGLPEFAFMHGGIQRVAYRLQERQLIRTTWEVVDQGPLTEHHDQILATDIEDLKIEQLTDGRYSEIWPPLNQAMPPQAVPAMVRITLALADGDTFELLAPGPDKISEASVNPGGGGNNE